MWKVLQNLHLLCSNTCLSPAHPVCSCSGQRSLSSGSQGLLPANHSTSCRWQHVSPAEPPVPTIVDGLRFLTLMITLAAASFFFFLLTLVCKTGWIKQLFNLLPGAIPRPLRAWQAYGRTYHEVHELKSTCHKSTWTSHTLMNIWNTTDPNGDELHLYLNARPGIFSVRGGWWVSLYC